jgi:RecJ-like exonuclease
MSADSETTSTLDPGNDVNDETFPRSLSLTSEFKTKLLQAAEIIKGTTETVRVVSHYDGDGITAAGILTNALGRKNIRFHASMIKGLNRKKIEKIAQEENNVQILSDFGSAQIDDVEQLLVGNRDDIKLIICDHHQPIRPSDKAVLLNCHYLGIDGTYEACAATITFLLAIAMDPINWDLADLAIAGCIADKQHLTGMKGLNLNVLQEAEKRGVIRTKQNLKLSGTDLYDALKTSVEPFFIGLSGNENEVNRVLTELNVVPEGTSPSESSAVPKLEDLTEPQIKRIGSYLAARLVKQGVRTEFIESIITDRYWSVGRSIDVEDLSANINACGRLDRMGTGLAVCLFDRGALEKAKLLRAEHKRKIIFGLQKVINEGVKFLDNIQYFYTTETTYAGTFAGLGMIYLFDHEKPTIVLSERDGKYKISGRGTSYLVDKGLDLANALDNAASGVNGYGGGHTIAAGATIPLETDQEFLKELDIIIGTQLKGQTT